MLDEGYIKFDCQWTQSVLEDGLVSSGLLNVRDELFRLGLIGVLPDSGIGFGNVSMRLAGSEILISGSATGSFFPSTPSLFSKVYKTDLLGNRVWCLGEFPASSETFTHEAVYKAHPSVQCVLHVHHRASWLKLLGLEPTTSVRVAYGTVEMAEEVGRLFSEKGMGASGLFVMAGHEDGLVAFGRNFEEALNILLAKTQ
jgi:ribulose-5-phosphate 4-epimerase/fuculose-1-phosphate aldolase